MPKLRKYPPELKDRAVRLVIAARDEDGGRRGACTRVGQQLGIPYRALPESGASMCARIPSRHSAVGVPERASARGGTGQPYSSTSSTPTLPSITA